MGGWVDEFVGHGFIPHVAGFSRANIGYGSHGPALGVTAQIIVVSMKVLGI